MYGTTLVACLSQSCPSGGQRCEICVGIQKPLQTSRQTACNTPLSKNRALSRAHNSSRPISGTKTNFCAPRKRKKKNSVSLLAPLRTVYFLKRKHVRHVVAFPVSSWVLCIWTYIVGTPRRCLARIRCIALACLLYFSVKYVIQIYHARTSP